jgi:putative ABC transport system permease protein
LVLGLPDQYRRMFPGEVRTLAGRGNGVLIAQQAAANLHVGPGDQVEIGRAGRSRVAVRIDGVVDLPHANTLFQTVGAPPGAQPTAPPDDVLLVPTRTWARLYPPSFRRPDTVTTQIHARLHRADLPTDPAAAFTVATSSARHLEADAAGTALVGDNLGATLDAARSDALYAEVLFILLGLPGVVLAGLLAAVVASAGRNQRRRELALLRTRGATAGTLARIATAEAGAVAVVAAAIGLILGGVVGRLAFGSAVPGATTSDAATWMAVAVLVGTVVVVAAVGVPAHRDVASATVAKARSALPVRRQPRVLRYGVDAMCLVAGALVQWATSRGGYAVVLSPEGVPSVSVS